MVKLLIKNKAIATLQEIKKHPFIKLKFGEFNRKEHKKNLLKNGTSSN